MRRTLCLIAATLCLGLACGATAATDTGGPYHKDAMGCRDAANHLVGADKCAAPAKKAPNCNPKKSKPCGMSCIALDKECHIK